MNERYRGNGQGGFQKFTKEWIALDRYNEILREMSEQQEVDSITAVSGLSNRGGRVIVSLARWNPLYKVDSIVDISDDKEGKWHIMGKIFSIEEDSHRFEVECTDEKVMGILPALEQRASQGRSRVRIRDVGTRVRLKRQRGALRSLYEDNTANPKLRTILISNGRGITCNCSPDFAKELTPYLLRFQENMRQKKAFAGALSASDLYLIQGPPGTGKTTLMAELVNYLVASGKCVLISSETHVAVDNLLERIEYRDNVWPIRLGNESDVGQSVATFLPGNRAEFLRDQIKKGLRENEEFYHNAGSLESRFIEKKRREIDSIEKRISDIRQNQGMAGLSDSDMARITKYLELLDQCMGEYQEYQDRKAEWDKEEERISKIRDERGRTAAQLVAVKQAVLNTDGLLRVLKDTREEQVRELERKLAYLDNRLAREQGAGLEKEYLRLKERYRQTYRRLRVERAFVERKKGSQEITKSEYVFRIQKSVREIQWLREKRQEMERGFDEELKLLCQKMHRRTALMECSGDIRTEWAEAVEYVAVQDELKELYLRLANVVCATCSGIASNENAYFHQKKYDYVIVDEAAKCATLDLLIPMTRGRKIILVGDHKQLSPMVDMGIQEKMTPEELAQVRNSILFKQLYEGNVPDSCKVLLDIQYRMDESIFRFISETFYEGRLQNGIGVRPHHLPGINSSMVFIDCPDSKEERQGTSYVNKPEAMATLRLLERLNRLAGEKKTVGIISTYKGQARWIEALLKKRGKRDVFSMLDIESHTVDAFQGKEKQIIILNLVRSSRFSAFVRDDNRMNVAVSRAQELLLVVGSERCVEREEEGPIIKLYRYLRENGWVRYHSSIELWG